jgi:energy-coupling factor transporter ATP-binding protein EcfA2
VLFLGNYSSGKSTLINELLGVPIQATGQAPTDDCFTVITYDEVPGPVRVTEERDGCFLLLAGAVGGTAALLTAVAWGADVHRWLFRRFQRQTLASLDRLVPLDSQTRRDTWQAVQPLAVDFIQRTAGRFFPGEAHRDFDRIHHVATEGAAEIRTALNELAGMRPEGPSLIPPPSSEGGSVLPLKNASPDKD